MRLAAALVVLAACGRVGFDPGDQIDAVALAPCGSAPSLVACYAFEGDTRDGTPNHNDPTIASIGYGPGIDGQAAELVTTSRFQVPDSASLGFTQALTLEAWVRIDEDAMLPERSVLADRNAGYSIFEVAGLGLGCRVNTSGAQNLYERSGVFQLGIWIHVACTYDGVALVAYANGAVVGSIPITGPIDVPDDGVEVGGNWVDTTDTYPERLVGGLDQLRIWSVARTPAEICAAAGCGP